MPVKTAPPEEYVVTGPYCTVKTMTTDGWRVVGLYEGAPVPLDVPQEAIDHLLLVGLIHKRGWVAPSPSDQTAEAQAAYAAAQLRSAEVALEEAKNRRDEAAKAVEAANTASGAADKATAKAKTDQEAVDAKAKADAADKAKADKDAADAKTAAATAGSAAGDSSSKPRPAGFAGPGSKG